MQDTNQAISEAVKTGKLSKEAVASMREVLGKTTLDTNKVNYAVFSAIDWQIQYYLEKRYCSKEGVITSVVLGINDWLGEQYKNILPSQEFSQFIRKRISDGLDDIVIQVARVYKQKPGEIALFVADSVKKWLDKLYLENEM